MSPRRLAPVALLLGPLALLAVTPAWESLLLPEARTAEVIEGPSTRVTVHADGRIEHEGHTWVPTADVRLPDLAGPLRAFHAAAPDGLVLLAGDRRADFRAVRAVLATANDAGLFHMGLLAAPDATPPRAIRVSQRVRPANALAQAGPPNPLVPISIHLRADALVVARRVEDLVTLPRVDGALPLAALAALLDEDRRLHPSARVMVLNTDDGVAYADTFAALDLTREKGYSRTLLAGGPAHLPHAGPPAPPALEGKVERPTEVTLHPNGDADLGAPGGKPTLVQHREITGYEAHCDATICDIVLRREGQRAALGTRPRAVPLPDALFGRPVYTYAGRLGLPEPKRTGTWSPLVLLPGVDLSDEAVAEGKIDDTPILLGALPKEHISKVIADHMDEIRVCYERLLDKEPKAQGKVVVKFVIATDGTVSSSVIKSSDIANEDFQRCFPGTFSTFRFDPPLGGGVVIVSYPFLFSPA